MNHVGAVGTLIGSLSTLQLSGPPSREGSHASTTRFHASRPGWRADSSVVTGDGVVSVNTTKKRPVTTAAATTGCHSVRTKERIDA